MDKLSNENLMKVNAFITQVKRGKMRGRYEKGRSTAEILRIIINTVKPGTPTSFVLSQIREFGRRVSKELETEMVISNIIRRILFVIRDELKRETLRAKKQVKSLDDLEFSHQPDLMSVLDVEQSEDFNMDFILIKGHCIEGIKELIVELEDVYNNITEYAIEHIHANDVILTFGYSKSVESVLLGSMKKRKFNVVVTDNSPSDSGHLMAEMLTKSGIQATLIPLTNVFAVMSKVNKVVIGASAVMAKGGFISGSGIHQMCLAAKYFSVPVVVICGLYKMTPVFPVDQDSFNNLGNPKDVLKFEVGSNMKEVSFVNPEYDYVPPHLVTLIITNIGTYNSNYVYRLLGDYYSPLDYTFQ
jgi:translation initiation factor eIF-2B subunit beta